MSLDFNLRLFADLFRSWVLP